MYFLINIHHLENYTINSVLLLSSGKGPRNPESLGNSIKIIQLVRRRHGPESRTLAAGLRTALRLGTELEKCMGLSSFDSVIV